ncbi:MAG: acyl-CoA dehydrogenase family protein [Deltaproteobacteria bacterium]|nr:acyl-CoA dehydrogenase family protein [Candidatus Anaeroferrophillus wilburensis]MBN2888750.1 acyl-CoA dehydrogenase family protein [Deltaproteobacteria bacterium]
MNNCKQIPGGGFLITETSPEHTFIPEDFSEEQRLIAKTTEDFVRGEILPRIDEIEVQQEGVAEDLMRQAGELGLLMADIPEAYQGLGLDKASSALITEKMGMAGSFSVTHAAHVGISTLPFVFYGTEEQKRKYLPGLGRGDIGSYCLTEPGSGSDALAAKTTASLSNDGTCYLLNGSKQFITNARWAKTFVVFAKINGQDFSAFIVERGMPGVSIGLEEKKLGIKGSSTASLILENVEVPAANLLGEVGKGHLIAFNILNIGRYKLGAGCLGAAKLALEDAVRYAGERYQFKKSLNQFGLIRKKIAQMATEIFVAESATYRLVGMIDDILAGNADDHPSAEQVLEGIEEYAIECSIVKILASEMLDFVVDEGLQIHGGYGYCQEYPAERLYRDSRINRIFEGTNEINRILIPGMLVRRGLKGQLPLMKKLADLQEEVKSGRAGQCGDPAEGFLEVETRMVRNAKKATLMVAGLVIKKHLQDINEQQELLGLIAEMIIEVFALESALLRVGKLMVTMDDSREDDFALLATRNYLYAAFSRLAAHGEELLAAVLEGEQLVEMLRVLKRYLDYLPQNTVIMRDKLAAAVIEHKGYPRTY